MSLLLAFGAPSVVADYVQELFYQQLDEDEDVAYGQFIDQMVLVETIVDLVIDALADGPDDELFDEGGMLVAFWDGSFDEPVVVVEVSEWLIRARRRGRRT